MTNPLRHPRVSLSLLLALAAAVTAALLVAGPASASGSYTCPTNTGADVQTGINDGGTVYIRGTCHGNFYVNPNNALNVTLIGLGTNPTLNGDGNGPVLEISGPANVTIKNLTLTNGSSEVGGGILAHFACDETDTICGSPTVTVIGSKITGNFAAAGGGVYAEDCVNLTVTNTTVSSNSAVDGDGGGLLLENCPFLTMTGASVTKNTAAGYGGGLALYNADASINASTFSLNTAQNESGGGIESEFSNVQVSNSKLTTNTAYAYGGGIDFGNSQGCGESPVGSPTRSTHDHGAAPASEICIGAPAQRPNLPAPLPTGLTVMNSTIDHNTAMHDGGGGISNYAFFGDSPVSITNTTLSFNVAPGNDTDGDSGGGGFYQDSCGSNASTSITTSKIYGNTAMNSMGGGISNVAFCDGGADLTVAATSLQNPNALQVGNQAKYGGGIYNAFETASVGLSAHSVVARNKATVNGGGIYNDCAGSLTIAPVVTFVFNTPNNIFNSAGCLIAD